MANDVPALQIKILDILRKHSDEEHCLKQTEIRRLFRQQYGADISVKKLRSIL